MTPLWIRSRPRAVFIICVFAIATLMAFVGTWGWQVANLPIGPAAGTPIGNGWIVGGLFYAPLSWITWAILTPFLIKRRIWVIVPIGIISPFLGSTIFCLGLFARSLPKGVFEAAVAIFTATAFTVFSWGFVLETARVTLPVGIATATMIWLTSNWLLPPNHSLDRPAAR
jgi:hypothetical protein